jgi:hypothetical protein
MCSYVNLSAAKVFSACLHNTEVYKFRLTYLSLQLVTFETARVT